jgi:hypothetical protein
MRSKVLGVCLLVGCGGVSGAAIGDGGSEAGDASDSAAVDASPDASTISITLGSCPDPTPCGGDVTGTWDLTAGCIDDPLATAKSVCPALVVNTQVATASGSVTFANGIVARNYVTHYGMDITIPTSCLQGASCAQAQTLYQAYIPNTTCSTVTAGCECTGSVDTTGIQGSTYTTANDEIVTAGGDHYAYCVTGTSMQYRHTSGPTPDLGSYVLTQQ